MRDITPEREAEAEMRRLRLQLWHADRVAQTGAITASLAHELNQPLTGILSTAQAGLTCLLMGDLRTAQRVARWFERVWKPQPQPRELPRCGRRMAGSR